MLRRLWYALLMAMVSCGLSAVAKATPIAAGTYTLGDTTVLGSGTPYELTGTVTIGSNGLLSGADITLEDAALGNPVFNVVSGPGSAGYEPVADYASITNSASTGQIYLSYLPTLNSSGGVSLCILSASDCNSYQASTLQVYSGTTFGYDDVDLSSGSLTAGVESTVTPEPATLVLLPTGVLALLALGRRRMRNI